MDLRRPARLASALAASALVLAGCSLTSGNHPTAASSSTTTPASASTSAAPGGAPSGKLPDIGTSPAADLKDDPAGDAAYQAYYSQKMAWGDCPDRDGAQCGTLTVPKVWKDPSQGNVTLALLRIPATGQSRGTLFMNPGGPGGSGVDFVGESATSIVSKEVRRDYDLVGFDPRGVGSSDPIRCLDDQQTDQYLAASGDLGNAQGVQEAQDWMHRVADSCQQNSGDLLGDMDTLSAARDMDVMRAAVGADHLDYLGFSYGTYLGATYADLYPARVGRFVLDGAIDPTLTGDQIAAGQADGFETAVHHFAQWCLDQGSQLCPLTGDADHGVQQIRDLFASIDANPLPTKDPARPLTGSLARTGVLVGLYSDESWGFIAQAVKAAMNGDGTQLLGGADTGNERDADGHYPNNGTYSITAVNCLDHPAVEDQTWMATEEKRLSQKDPTFGPTLGYSGMACAAWPDGPVRKPAPIHAKGSGPIVVVGTVYDPATPYPWAQALAEQLDNGHLITWKGEGHTAYGRSGGCIEKAADAYLLQGTVPQDGLTCG